MRVVDLAEAIAPGVELRMIGIRPGEKLHEVLITADESRHTVIQDDVYTVVPEYQSWLEDGLPAGRPLDEGFTFSSGTNEWFLDVEALQAQVEGAARMLS